MTHLDHRGNKEMTGVNLVAVRQVLEAKRQELERRTCRREDILIEITADELDRMQQTVTREVAIRNIDRESNTLKDVIAAIGRLSQGTYGTCLCCEETIPEKRLRAVPWAAYCVVCQDFLEHTRPKDHTDDEQLYRAG